MRPGEGGMEKREEEGVSVKEIHTKERWRKRRRLYDKQNESEREGEEQHFSRAAKPLKGFEDRGRHT